MVKLLVLLYLLSVFFDSCVSLCPAQCPFATSFNAKGSKCREPNPTTLTCLKPNVRCLQSKYRSYDGSCNNLRYPNLGTPHTPYTRLLQSNYGDGVSSPSLSKTEKALPSAREVSNVVYTFANIQDPKYNLNAMQYGQFIVHDSSLVEAQPVNAPPSETCPFSSTSYPIPIPINDPTYGNSNVTCMNFLRTNTTRTDHCSKKEQPVEQLTMVNHFLDLSIVYGLSVQDNKRLRSFKNGKLKVDIRNNQQWLPTGPNSFCNPISPKGPCYTGGDIRVNQNPQLTLLQTIFLREHNRIATFLDKLNPYWNDETIFQEARKINIAQHQQITYYEWLPLFIGKENALKRKIIYDTTDFVNDYQENIDVSTINEYSNGASRFFHSLVEGRLQLLTENRTMSSFLRLGDFFDRSSVALEPDDHFDQLARGLVTQHQSQADHYVTKAVTQFLFRDERVFGQDLKAIDIQRNRDHGLATYNDFRKFCGLKKVTSFDEFSDVIRNKDIKLLHSLYEDPNDVELTVGGSLERLVDGTLMGPTFLCIFNEHHYRKRVGDRFWFENDHKDTGFSLEQLNQIRKATVAKLICQNTKIRNMQLRSFEVISLSNILVDCDSIPSINLSLWKDFSSMYI